MISAKFLWGNIPLGGELQTDAKESKFEIFESTLYIKSVSMPLTLCIETRGYEEISLNKNWHLIKIAIHLDSCAEWELHPFLLRQYTFDQK